MSTAVHGAQDVGGMQRPHDKGERAVVFMVSTTTHNGDREGVRGLKNRLPGLLLSLDPREEDGETCLCLGVWVWV